MQSKNQKKINRSKYNIKKEKRQINAINKKNKIK